MNVSLSVEDLKNRLLGNRMVKLTRTIRLGEQMKILVPVDGSKNSLKAVQYAAKLAQDLRSKSSIVVISVHDDSSLAQVIS